MAVSKTKYSTKKQTVSYEIPNSFNPFEMGERIIRVEEELKRQRELMLEIFKSTDKRFEDMQKNMDKRFEAIDKRFEDMQKNMDKRFEAMQQNMDKRFEDMQKNIDKRFNVMLWIIAGGFAGTWSILAILLSKLI